MLARIVAACSRPGDTGSGTTLVAAERAGRRWVGIDSAAEAIAITIERLRTTFGNAATERIAIEGLAEEQIATGPDTATRIDEARPR